MRRPSTRALQADLLDIAWFVRPHGRDAPCCGNLGAAEVRALTTVAGDGQVTIQDIADALGVTRSGATRVVDRLEGSGLAVRCSSTVDKRCTCVELTEAGRDALGEASECFDAILASVLAPLPRAERRSLASSLSTLTDLIGRYRAERTWI